MSRTGPIIKMTKLIPSLGERLRCFVLKKCTKSGYSVFFAYFFFGFLQSPTEI